MSRLRARGRTADVYDSASGTVVKLFHARYLRERVEREAEITRIVRAEGLPTPEVIGVVKLDHRYGIRFRRFDGPLLFDLICRDPDRIPDLAGTAARLHLDIHRRIDLSGLDDLKERLAGRIGEAPGLSRVARRHALINLARLPASTGLCHGDFHPANLIATPDGLSVIDWADATVGPPAADVARSILLMDAALLTSSSILPQERTCLRRFRREYAAAYCSIAGEEQASLDAWLPLVAIARLCERVPGEEFWLGEVAARGLP